MDRREFVAAAAASLAVAAAPARAATGEPVRMRDLYNKDLTFSPLAEDLAGRRIVLGGFMAPPIKADGNFFVLTRRPMAVCPFCESAAEWPPDIVAIYLKRALEIMPYNIPIVAHGVLTLGEFRDPDTGFVSRVRLTDSSVAEA